MAFAGILTFYGLLIAAYSLLKKHQKILINLRLSLFDKCLFWILLAISFICVLTSDYYKDFPSQTSLFKIKFEYSFLLICFPLTTLSLFFIYLGIKIKINKLKRKKITLFRELIINLFNNKEYSELLEILKKEYKRIIKYANSYSLINNIKIKLLEVLKSKPNSELTVKQKNKIYKIIQENDFIVSLINQETKKEQSYFAHHKNKFLSELKNILRKFIKIFIKNIEDNNKYVAEELVNLLLNNKEFVSKLVEYDPEFGLEIIKFIYKSQLINWYYDYVDLFFYEMIKRKGSILYLEIRNNQDITSIDKYIIKSTNIILSYLLSNCQIANDLRVYKGIGNYVIEYLQKLNRLENDPNNYGFENFNEYKWDSPIYVGIRFLDIMITECIHQGIRCHLAIHYLYYFTERILKNIKIATPLYNDNDEYNTKYSYLLEDIILTIIKWIRIIDNPYFEYKESLKKENCSYENTNMIKSSIICLIKISKSIAENNGLPIELKRKYINSLFDLLFHLRTSSKEVRQYSNVLLNCIKECMIRKSKRCRSNFITILKLTYNEFDKIPYLLHKKSKAARKLDQEIQELFLKCTDNKLY